MDRKTFKVAALVVVALASPAGVMVGISSNVDASTHCASGGTCFTDNNNFTGTSYRNTTGHLAHMGDVGLHDKVSAIGDSTSSASYDGVNLFADVNCAPATNFVMRGADLVFFAGGSWNDQLDAFKLHRVDGGFVSC